ncbi:fungal-specific transcription factor domain-containing protein [Lipomyces arxii]|uniref:fungal-specific transcription factor domain-containing protein n=1 Tax=Lipomyces arxii TaxID=56418 RepID=UPI0034CEEE09
MTTISQSPQSLRTHSISSGHKYACDYDGCDRSYNRLEHLTRHKLNHNPVARRFSCPTCSKLFVRGDLLRRHMPSHSSSAPRGRKRKISTEQNASPPQNNTDSDDTDPSAFNGSSSTIPAVSRTSPADAADEMQETIRRLSDVASSEIPLITSLPTNSIENLDTINDIDNDGSIEKLHNVQDIDAIESKIGMDTNFSVDMIPVFGENVLDFSNFPFDDRFTNWLLDENCNGDGAGSEGSIGTTASLPIDSSTFAILPGSEFGFVSLPSPPQHGELVSPETLNGVFDIYANVIPDLADYPQMNCQTVSSWVHLYWRNFHPQYPILHKPTSDPNTLPPHLLVAIFTLGTKYDPDQSAAEMAIKLHLHLRALVYSCPDFVPPAKLWVFQTLLLGEMFEKIVANRHLHEMSHVFHGTLITLMRRGSSLVNPELADDGSGPEPSSTLERHWKQWIKTESTIRTAFFAFIVDIQHAEMFGHTPALYANELSLELPCDDNMWNAADSETWGVLVKNTKRRCTTFFASLKLVMSHGWNRLRLNPFGRYIVLHGLLSISWTMRQRGIISGISSKDKKDMDQSRDATPRATPRVSRATTPEPVSKLNADWDLVVYKAFETWKLAFDLSESENPSASGIPYILASSSLHRLGIIRIYTDVLQLHVYAGLSNVLGRPIRAQDWLRAEESMKVWARSPGSSISVWHASRLVSGAFLGQTTYSADSDIVLHRPWCIYVACLVLWAYGYAMENCSRKYSDYILSMTAPPSASSSSGASSASQSVVNGLAPRSFRSQRPVDAAAWKASDDMERYLESLLAISDPVDIPTLQTRNCTIGLMTYAGNMFKNCRWTLLGEEAAYHCHRLACEIPVRS